jgi:hypothetical protein
MRNLCLLLLLIIGTGLTPAAQVSYDFTIPASGSPATVNFTNSTDIPLFDPLLGTLLSIEIDLEGTINGSQFVDNEDPNPITDGSGATTVNMALSNVTAGNLLNVAPVATFTFSISGDTDVNPNFAGTDFVSNSFEDISDAANTVISDAAVLAIFTGNGTITLDLTAIGSFQVTPGGNVATLTFTEGIGRGTVTYVFDDGTSAEIPEPLTMMLIGTGLAIIGVRNRKRISPRMA